jgi:hypothetical protein
MLFYPMLFYAIVFYSVLSIYGSTAFVGPWPLYQFLHFYTVDRTPWTGGLDRHKTASYLRTQDRTNTQ